MSDGAQVGAPTGALARRPVDLDTALLRTFQTLAATRSFTRTAEIVGRTQSAVSQQMQKLEAAAGQPLVVRSRRNVQLTTAGEVLLGHVRQALDVLDQGMAKLSAPEAAGEVRFGSPEDFATFFLPDVLARFMERYPNVRLRTHCELTLSLEQGLASGTYDLVVLKQEPGRLPPDAVPLWRERLVWVGAEQELPPAVVDADGAVRLVLSPEPCVYRKRAIEALARAGLRWSVVYTSPSLAGAAAAVRAGLGITVLPRNMVPSGLGSLESFDLPDLRETSMCMVLAAEPTGAARAFARFIRERLQH